MKAVFTLLAASAVIASPIVTSSKYKRQTVQGQDFEIVNLARNLESLELSYWNQGLTNFTAENFTSAGYDGFYTFLSLFRDQEIAHFTVLNEAAGGMFANCTYTFPVTTPEEFITLGQVVTSVGEGAFLGALGNLTAPSARQTAGEIIGNEARQNSYLRQTLGLKFFNAVNFDTPLTASQAYSLAKPFFACPASNAPINFTLIPPITASFASGQPGNVTAAAQINLMWNASVTLAPGAHIQFLSDVYSVAAPLTQNGNGTGSTTLPQGMNGTTFLVATEFGGQGPIPDAQNLAVGYIVVA